MPSAIVLWKGFNLLSIVLFLPLEVWFGVLERLSGP